MNIIESLNRGLEERYNLKESKEDRENFISFIYDEIKDRKESEKIADRFDNLKKQKRLKGDETDYYYWIRNKSVNELINLLDTLDNTLSKTQQTKKEKTEGAEQIYCPNKDWVIYKITTYEAAQRYGEDTHWCITGNKEYGGEEAFKKYLDFGAKDYYFFWKKGFKKGDSAYDKWCYVNRGQLLTISSEQFYNAIDNCTSLRLIIEDVPLDVLECLPYIKESLKRAEKEEIEVPSVVKEIKETGVFNYNQNYSSDFVKSIQSQVSIEKVVVSGEADCISDDCFNNIKSLKEVVLSDKIIHICPCAFLFCEELEKIIIPNGVQYIGEEAFKFCTSLKEIELPDSIKSIAMSAFCGCTALTQIKLPKNITIISTEVFWDCKSLQKISIPENVTAIDAFAFCGCTDLKEVKFPNTLKRIAVGAFDKCDSLSDIVIPSSVTYISWRAFRRCKALNEVKIHGKYRDLFDFSSFDKESYLVRNDNLILNWVDCGIKETFGELCKKKV